MDRHREWWNLEASLNGQLGYQCAYIYTVYVYLCSNQIDRHYSLGVEQSDQIVSL
jgi:hypothetical protein